jgi:hypothetical protein
MALQELLMIWKGILLSSLAAVEALHRSRGFAAVTRLPRESLHRLFEGTTDDTDVRNDEARFISNEIVSVVSVWSAVVEV